MIIQMPVIQSSMETLSLKLLCRMSSDRTSTYNSGTKKDKNYCNDLFKGLTQMIVDQLFFVFFLIIVENCYEHDSWLLKQFKTT